MLDLQLSVSLIKEVFWDREGGWGKWEGFSCYVETPPQTLLSFMLACKTIPVYVCVIQI